MKRIRYYTVAAATAVVLACFVGPGIASASPTASEMCNTDQVGQGLCAQATGNKSNDYFKMEKKASSSLFTPTTRSGTAQMRLAGTNLCLTQDNGYAPNVVLNTCKGLARQEWIPRFIPGGTFVEYSYQNEYTKNCLNDDYFLHELNAATCNDGADQIFFFPAFPAVD